MPGSVEKMQQTLKWLGVEFDEGPSIGGKFGPYIQVSVEFKCTMLIVI